MTRSRSSTSSSRDRATRGLTYEGAASLLGFTDGELLDATIDALAAGDGAAVFTQIDKVIESGHDPRRFVEDLLERLRDLIIVAAVPEGAASVLRGVPEDQLERMRGQQSRFGPGALTRAADIVNAGLTEMTGATAPRMQLERSARGSCCRRRPAPAGYAARLDRLERRLDLGGVPSSARPPESGSAEPSGARTSSVPARPRRLRLHRARPRRRPRGVRRPPRRRVRARPSRRRRWTPPRVDRSRADRITRPGGRSAHARRHGAAAGVRGATVGNARDAGGLDTAASGGSGRTCSRGSSPCAGSPGRSCRSTRRSWTTTATGSCSGSPRWVWPTRSGRATTPSWSGRH